MPDDRKRHRTTMRFSPELREALALHCIIENTNRTELVERVMWDFLEDKGGAVHRQKRITRLVEAAGLGV